jgi:hypothetical protein
MGEFEMMKKTTSALAVAALLGTGAASAATFQVNDDTSFSVTANLGYTYVSTENGSETVTDFSDNSSDFRFSGEHVGSNGITTSLYLELDNLNGVDSTEDGLITDQAYVGFAGDFGSVQIGSDLGTYGAVDGLKDIDAWAGVTGFGNDAENSIRYTAPTMNGFTAAAAVNTYDDLSGGTKSGTSVNGSITYDAGVATLSAAYDSNGGEATPNDEPFYGVGAQFDLAGVDTRVTYEKDTNENTEVTLTSVTGIYSVGALTYYGSVQEVSGDQQADVTNTLQASEANFYATPTADSDSVTQYTAGVSYAIADNASIILETTRYGAVDDAGDQNSISVFVGF